MTIMELEQATGYSDKPVRQALRKLEAMGLVEYYGRAPTRSNHGQVMAWLRKPQTNDHQSSINIEQAKCQFPYQVTMMW